MFFRSLQEADFRTVPALNDFRKNKKKCEPEKFVVGLLVAFYPMNHCTVVLYAGSCWGAEAEEELEFIEKRSFFLDFF